MGLALDEPKEGETPVPVNGIDLLIADSVRLFADDATVDYVKDPSGEGFIITASGESC